MPPQSQFPFTSPSPSPTGDANQIQTTTTTTTTRIYVRGICCESEIPLCKKLLSTLPGVGRVEVSLTLKEVTVSHNAGLSGGASVLVDVLNEASLDASLVRNNRRRASKTNFGKKINFLLSLLSHLPSAGLVAFSIYLTTIILRLSLVTPSSSITMLKYLPFLAIPCGLRIYKRAYRAFFRFRTLGLNLLSTVVIFASCLPTVD